MTGTQARIPWQAYVAGPLAGLSAALFGLGALMVWTLQGGEEASGHGDWVAFALAVPALAQFAGVLLLKARRDWRLLTVTSAVTAAPILYWVVGAWAAGVRLGALVAFCPLAGLLAATAPVRNWVSAGRADRGGGRGPEGSQPPSS